MTQSYRTMSFTTYLNYKHLPELLCKRKWTEQTFSVHFEEEWNPILQKRSGLILQGERPQYNLFRDYVFSNLEMFWNICGTQYCVFGEGLWQQHGVGYDKLPDFFVVFDVLDKKTGNFLGYEKVKTLIGDRLTLVPLILELNVDKSADQGTKLREEIKSKLNVVSHYGKEQQEGLYVRFEDDEKVLYRAKIRRKTFTSGRTDFDTNPVKNKLKST